MTIKQLVEKLDQDGDGQVTSVEFRAALRDLGLTSKQFSDSEIDGIFAEISAAFDKEEASEISVRDISTALHKMPKPKRSVGRDVSLRAGLDRTFAPYAYGSKLLHIVKEYEEMRAAKEEALTKETAARKERGAASAAESSKKEKAQPQHKQPQRTKRRSRKAPPNRSIKEKHNQKTPLALRLTQRHRPGPP